MLARWLYTLLFVLLLPAILCRLLWRSLRAPEYRRRWGERLAYFPAPTFALAPIWIHAVSVGETLAALPLIRQLRARTPRIPLVITTITPTGSARVRALFADEIARGEIFHVYAPYDVPWLLQRFVRVLRPQLLVIMETELWPNTLAVCAQQDIPVLLANARLSEKSARGYGRFAPLTRAMLRDLDCVAAQNAVDGQRFVQLGLAEKNLAVTGSIKFDLDISERLQQQARELQQQWSLQGQRPVWLVASTHPGEDEIVLQAFAAVRKNIPALLLVLVPRHPERFDSVYRLCTSASYRVARRSEKNASLENIDILVGDTMGELLLFYGACDLAFVGGSLLPVGGHNLIEPAAWGKPVLSGPHLHNFVEISQLLQGRNALVICSNAAELADAVQRLLGDAAERQQLGARALQVATENRGALQRLLSILEGMLTAK